MTKDGALWQKKQGEHGGVKAHAVWKIADTARKCSLDQDEKRPWGNTGALCEIQVRHQPLRTPAGRYWDDHSLLGQARLDVHYLLGRARRGVGGSLERARGALGGLHHDRTQIIPNGGQRSSLYQELVALLLNSWSKLLHWMDVKLKHLFLKLLS